MKKNFKKIAIAVGIALAVVFGTVAPASAAYHYTYKNKVVNFRSDCPVVKIEAFGDLGICDTGFTYGTVHHVKKIRIPKHKCYHIGSVWSVWNTKYCAKNKVRWIGVSKSGTTYIY